MGAYPYMLIYDTLEAGSERHALLVLLERNVSEKVFRHGQTLPSSCYKDVHILFRTKVSSPIADVRAFFNRKETSFI